MLPRRCQRIPLSPTLLRGGSARSPCRANQARPCICPGDRIESLPSQEKFQLRALEVLEVFMRPIDGLSVVEIRNGIGRLN